jgi:hypothetical protein
VYVTPSLGSLTMPVERPEARSGRTARRQQDTAARQRRDLVVGTELLRGGLQCFSNLLPGRQHDRVIGAEPGVHGLKAETFSATGEHKRCTTR